jgi:hypothetical protein
VIKPRARRQWDQAESKRGNQLRPTENCYRQMRK